MTITLKSPREIDKMYAAGQAAMQVLVMIEPYIVPGVTTEDLNKRCHDYIINELGCVPAPLNYHGFPKSICTSVNHVICHGIPSEKKLKKGDIINVDITVIKDGYHGDCSKMFGVGKVSILAARLMRVSHECLIRGLNQIKPGGHLGDIGHAIAQHAHYNGFSVVREYCGHGIGLNFHEDPQILHFGMLGEGLVMRAGMTFTVEPMINAGHKETRLLSDGWTVVTCDHKLSSQWEHTIVVTDDGFKALTKLPDQPL